MILKNEKHVFWEAFLIACFIFLGGFLLGYAFESSNIKKINDYYTQSEISLNDILVMNSLIDINQSDCSDLTLSNLRFADKIYTEARILENYEDSGKLNSDFWYVHRKYDLLRTFLWVDSIKTSQKCKDFNFIVYLYQYNQEDLTLKAEQNVWAKILYDLKQKQGANIVLIPIAVDSNLISLNTLVDNFNIRKYPVVIINNKAVLTDLTDVNDIEKYLN